MELWQAVASIFGALSPIIFGMALFFLQRAQKRRDEVTDRRAEERKKEALLMMKLVVANTRLTIGTALAYKRGAPNGELEDGLKACEKARLAYFDFVNESHFGDLEGW